MEHFRNARKSLKEFFISPQTSNPNSNPAAKETPDNADPDKLAQDSEDPQDYRLGGYHPTKPGDLFSQGRYLVESKLGWGHFSTVWLAWDSKHHHRVALKIVKSAKHYSEAAMDEIAFSHRIAETCERLQVEGHVVKMQDNFVHVGVNGRHVCMVFEVMGGNLLALIRRFEHRGLPIKDVRSMARQILLGLDLLHRHCSIIHTDLKPENILQCHGASPSRPDITVKIGDLGNACWTDHHFTNDIQTRQYRAPEIILGLPYDETADIWSAACVVFELATGDFLFAPKAGRNYPKDENHLALITELFGECPRYMTSTGKYSHEYYKHGALRHIQGLKRGSLKELLVWRYKMEAREAEPLAAFLTLMLEWSPRRRATAHEMLRHYWLDM